MIEPAPGAPQTAQAPSTSLTVAGPEAATQLNGWYNRTDRDCGGLSKPAFLCSGVMLRATETNPAFLPWDPSPGSIQSGGVSFSWLRTDNNFANLVFNYNNGFIFFPALETPSDKDSNIAVLCAFPMDADTNNRNSLQGCGPSNTYPLESQPCNEQGIITAQQWIDHFNLGANKYRYQCGWNVRDGQIDTANRFYQAILARQAMIPQWWAVQNELRLATWPAGHGANLPIQSFFYISGKPGALANAQNDQLRFYGSYKEVVPIVRLTLPANSSGKATFAYSSDDQAVGDGGPPPLAIDTTPVTLSGRVYLLPAYPALLPGAWPANTTIQRTATGGIPPYSYQSGNSGIAVVDNNGYVTVRGNGTTAITVLDSIGATKSYQVSATGVIQCVGLGKGTYSQISSVAGSQGVHIPNMAQLREMNALYGSRWPMGNDWYWSSDIQAYLPFTRYWIKNIVTGLEGHNYHYGSHLGVGIR
ncbi:Ig-like domain-containing protein [Burkholderia humptydooensis]|uniref:Ig-like domain-containing protein n=1 Tax=Burkholderia humptydooensis TaxID=430531 RepID=UPI001FD5D333|nr:Ig-like domain-containing protein [Burkholderia humptydooensis]